MGEKEAHVMATAAAAAVEKLDITSETKTENADRLATLTGAITLSAVQDAAAERERGSMKTRSENSSANAASALTATELAELQSELHRVLWDHGVDSAQAVETLRHF